MNNNQNNNDNIVKPIQVNTNNTNIDHTQDNFLNRERDNIVSATIQANESIDKNAAKTVNNEIKIHKNNPIITAIYLITGLAVAFFASSIAVSTIKEAEDYGTTTTTTTTTASLLQRQQAYLNDLTKVRKYQNDTYALILSPGSYDLVNGNNFYMLLTLGSKSLAGTPEYGTYNITGNSVILTGTNKTGTRQLNLTSSGLILDNYELQIKDTEMKSYNFTTKSSAGILIINGTLYNEQALFIKTDVLNTTYKTYKFTEDQSSITLEDGTVFTKNGMDVTNNGDLYTYLG